MKKRFLIFLSLLVFFVFSGSTVFARTVNAPKTSFPKATSGMVSITFDDGSKSQYENGWPILKKYGFRASFYITTKNLDGFWYMTPQMVKKLKKEGNQIAAHTLTHRDLTTLSSSELDYELREPKYYLENLLGVKINSFASPFGSYNSSVLEQIRKYYVSHRTVKEGFNAKGNINSQELLVQNVYSDTTNSQISQWIDTAKRNNSWLILVYHEIKENPDQWSTTPKKLDEHMSILKKSGVKVVTVDQALAAFASK